MKEGVLELPTITVRPTGNDSDALDWATPKGRLDLAMKTYKGLQIGNLFGLNSGFAMEMQKEEQLARKGDALVSTVQRTTLDDSAYSRETMRMLKNAIQRTGTP